MDYIGIDCPVCNKKFEQGDDVVVCPECGTPHHRECYEFSGHCINENKHSDNYSFDVDKKDKENSQENDDIIACPRCKTEILKGMFYCGKCGFPVGINKNSTAQNNGQPYTMPGIGFDVFDPMGGVDPEEDMGDGVKAGEISKYVQKSTSYFSRVFNNIKIFNRSKFNFAAFLFSGGYLLYRKMYKIGSIITAILLALMLTEVYMMFTPEYQNLISTLNDAMNSTRSYSSMIDVYIGLSGIQQFMMIFIYGSAVIQLILKIVVGVKANKWYFKHCKKQIVFLKENSGEKASADLETKGGVNVSIAISLFIVYMIISYLPTIMISFNLF